MKVQLTLVFYEHVWVESVTSRYGSLVCSLLYGISVCRVVRQDTPRPQYKQTRYRDSEPGAAGGVLHVRGERAASVAG